jgi:transposase
MMPTAVRTYAPRGETPELCASLSRDHLSAISAITPAGDLYTMIQEEAFDGEAIVRFLRHLLGQIDGKLLVIWDGLPAHRSRRVKAFLRRQGQGQVYLEQLPGYAPELNPDEGIWQYLKNVELAHVCCERIETLRRELRKAMERLRHKREVIISCFSLAGLPI